MGKKLRVFVLCKVSAKLIDTKVRKTSILALKKYTFLFKIHMLQLRFLDVSVKGRVYKTRCNLGQVLNILKLILYTYN